jgi:ATP-dependent helicase HrpB
MAALGNDPRLAAMLVAAQGKMKLPRRQNWRLFLRSRRAAAQRSGQAFSRNQGNWQQRAQQLVNG